ncbi:MAG: hypothetical protein BWY83_02926 [bacterium ADurb.Bin478]|nr:MAG: hypothetical protein BWY83_02926 [bacterium ADurb.Bin478]
MFRIKHQKLFQSSLRFSKCFGTVLSNSQPVGDIVRKPCRTVVRIIQIALERADRLTEAAGEEMTHAVPVVRILHIRTLRPPGFDGHKEIERLRPALLLKNGDPEQIGDLVGQAAVRKRFKCAAAEFAGCRQLSAQQIELHQPRYDVIFKPSLRITDQIILSGSNSRILFIQCQQILKSGSTALLRKPVFRKLFINVIVNGERQPVPLHGVITPGRADLQIEIITGFAEKLNCLPESGQPLVFRLKFQPLPVALGKRNPGRRPGQFSLQRGNLRIAHRNRFF